MSFSYRFVAGLLFATVVPSFAGGQLSTTDTRLLSQPAIAGERVAFIYAGDLWSAGLDGTGVRRLTTADGDETNPVFSPDGRSIAFSANYDGNVDVYVIPAEGGVPRRLTWHPGPDIAQAFTPDGRSVLFTSGRESHTGRYTQLFTVPVEGGVEQRLPIPNAARAAYSPDGQRIAYNPLAPRFLQWKRYRGGTVSRLWLYDTRTHAIEKIPQPDSRANDVDPMWVAETVYFRSDRDGEFNVYAWDSRTKQVRRITRHEDFPVLRAATDGSRLVYEQAGWLHVMELASGQSRRLAIGVAADLRETRPRWVRGADYIRSASLSPTGARAAFEVRGEIVTVPAEKGDPRVLTNTPAAHERSPAWSPDGTRVAYFSDATGEYELEVRPQEGRGEPRRYKPAGSGFYFDLVWSPDGRRVAYSDNSQSTFVLDLTSGRATRVGGNRYYTPGFASNASHAWSPDSRWLAYSVNTQPLVQTLYVYDVERDRSHAITDGLSEVTQPAFDRSGKYLYLFASTDAGPVQDWFAQSNADMRRTRGIYMVVLRNDLPNPLARESDEERGPAAADSARAQGDSARPGAGGGTGAGRTGGATAQRAQTPPRPEPVRIDLDGIGHRILALPVPPAELSAIATGESGHVYYLRTADGRTSLHRWQLGTRRAEQLLPEVAQYELSADGKKMLYRQGRDWFIVATGPRITAGEGRLAVADVEVRIDPRAEWAQIFDEAWRINRDYFYAPNMHGVDWDKARKTYSELLPHAAVRSDVTRVIQWMMSELSVGHHGGGGGDRLATPRMVQGGLLGADYTIASGRYRFARVYGGLNWTPELRSPLTEPGVNVRAGEYLLAVNGRDLRPPANLHSAFENTAGKLIDITVGPNANGTGSRTVQVVPLSSESALRNRAWVEDNLRKVDSATGGRVAYVYVPNTAQQGHSYFKRYFYPQAHKDAIIVDERYNGGGLIADYYIDVLRRPLISHWATRYGDDLRTPAASIQGPKAMIIDETAGSGGDLLPWMFRKFELGTLIGQPTWGGLVGTLGFPVLMDGGTITAPNLAIWTAEDGWVVENEGVPPDIYVEQTPADVIAGRDPQLERAIEVVMEQLRNTRAAATRPAFPDKTGGRQLP
ncbi:MAG TPA: PDZ domain-containing protein [Gemmatimonadaceae bacterium]|nr:PDZ domain-containing protein [Gemmatimonadaceae bacterium]